MAIRTVISGAGSGIGAATRKLLETRGHEVTGIDLRNAEITADLATVEGRAHAVAAAIDRCGGSLDALVLCAGLGYQFEPAGAIVSVNYFGAIDLLDGLLPALQRGRNPAAVVISSVASTQLAWDQNPLAAALEAGDEAAARAVITAAGAKGGYLAYSGSKNALTVAVRRRAAPWGKAGVRLNTIGPGATETPLLQAGLKDARYAQAIRDFVPPLGRRAQPSEMASVIAFLLGPDASYVHGAQLLVDGGIDAVSRPTRF